MRRFVSLFLELLLAVGYEGLRLQGPSGPVVAQLGDTVLLPCFSQSPLPLEGLQVEWRKTDSESLLIVFQGGEPGPEPQSQSFRGRVRLFPEEISKGNFSVLLHNKVKGDAGVYRCKVKTLQESSETEVELKDMEGLVVKGAEQPIIASVGEEVILNCSVDPHVPASEIEEVSWKRTDQDIIVLLYQNNEVLPDSSHERYQGRVRFFVAEIPKGNFSLRLKDVKMEDQGEFKCEVHTRDSSAEAIVVLERLGLSMFHMLILLLSFSALLLVVGFGLWILILLRKKVTSGKMMAIHVSLMLCPNLCMGVAFILWSSEASLTEIVTCSAVNFLRPLMLMKTFPYLDNFPGIFTKAVKTLVVPVYHSAITITACSVFAQYISKAQTGTEHILTLMVILEAMCFTGAAVLAGFDFQMHSAVVLQICNGALLGFLLSVQSFTNFGESLTIPSVLVPLIITNMMVLSLQRHYFQGKPFKCANIALPSVILTVMSLSELSVYVLIGVSSNNYTRGWVLPFEVLMLILTWILIVFLICRQSGLKEGCCSKLRGIGYVCCTVIATVLITAFGVMCTHYFSTNLEKSKGKGGYMALSVFLHVFAAISFCRHPRHLHGAPHFLIYMFGAVGLNIVNSITLITELSLKSGKGVRTVEDLQLIVLPFETVFFSGWLALQVYDAWTRMGPRIKQNFKDLKESGPQDLQEMEVLSASECKPADPSEDL